MTSVVPIEELPLDHVGSSWLTSLQPSAVEEGDRARLGPDLAEAVHAVCDGLPLVPDTIPEKAHTKYQGTNRGDVIGLIHMPALEVHGSFPFVQEEGGLR